MATIDPALRITYAGQPAITLALAAAEHGLSQRHMSTTISRLGIQPLPHATIPGQPARLDGRTVLYSSDQISRALRARPGRGANLRAAVEAPTLTA